ncbi:flagellar filament capping protein FliD [[Acidovorax] ebreus]|uniref:Flagellar hook-associated protein 2 n=1 Tax=Acidovorax ebreus (strain TPSY) TaxID=535289 RepID=A0A9J9QD87_ACIET|nr:flagellar filament capping protein FliD [[Acidovorax] ebreus]ACM34518.1 flagellar hook-associated 2 domain protein [[Acidovorax] ebreus TPSY]
MASFSSIGVGLGGNVDVNALIQASVDAVKLPISRTNGLNDQAKFTQSKISTFGQLKSMVSTLQTAASKLTSVTGWNAVSVASSDSSAVSATAIGGTVETNFGVEVQRLAKAQLSTSAALQPVGGKLGAGTLKLEVGRWDAGGGGAFTASDSVVGLDITVSANDTLADIAGKINGSNGSVTATILTDASGERLMLRSKATGEESGFRLSATDADGQYADGAGLSRLATGMATDYGANALATINGFEVTSPTNTFANAVAGVTFKAEKVTTAAVQITVTKDAAAVKKNIEDFVIAYNAANQALSDLTSYDQATKTAGLLQGDSTAVALQNTLRNVVQSLSSSTGAFRTLSDIGVGVIKGGDLSIDSTKLDTALNDPAALKALFLGADGHESATDGVAEKIKAATSKMLDSDGFFAAKDTLLQNALKRNAKEIERINDRADSTETLLKARYTALDSRMSQLNALNAYIAQQVTTWNKSSG